MEDCDFVAHNQERVELCAVPKAEIRAAVRHVERNRRILRENIAERFNDLIRRRETGTFCIP